MMGQYPILDTVSSFFSQLDETSRTDPERVARAYVEAVWKVMREQSSISLPPRDNLYNFSVLAKRTDLDFLTKRVHLISDTLVLAHYMERRKYHFDTLQAGRYGHRTDECYVRCPSLRQLGTWLLACRPLFIDRSLLYYPDILLKTEGTRFINTDPYNPEMGSYEEESTPTADDICEFIVHNRKLVESSNHHPSKSRLIRPILSVNLPYIEGTSLKDYSDITSNETEALRDFRNFLRYKFLDLDRAQGSEYFETELEKISLELEDGVRGVESELQRISHRRAVQAAQGVVGLVPAVLVAIDATALSSMVAMLGGASGLARITDALQDYKSNKMTVEGRPYYYLWLFKRRKTATSKWGRLIQRRKH